MAKPLTKEEILKAVDGKHEYVEVPEWGGGVYVWTMTAKSRTEFEDSIRLTKEETDKAKKAGLAIFNRNARVALFLACACDENGVQLFGLDDIPALSAKNSVAIDRVVEVAQRINAIGGAAEVELEKNSEETIPGASASA